MLSLRHVALYEFMKRERESGIELLRIVAMSMILIMHFVEHAITSDSISFRLYELLISLTDGAVCFFFLITGWFGVKFSGRKILQFVLTIFLYNVVNILLLYSFNAMPGKHTLLETLLFPVSAGNYWFMQVYLAILVTAPLLNRTLQELPISRLRAVILVFTIFTAYSCALGHNEVNTNGYTYMQALYLYCLGQYLRRDDTLYRRVPQWGCLAIYLLMKLLAIFCIQYRWEAIDFLGYNSLPMIIGTIYLFIFFKRFTFKSRLVNYLGGAAFGCYLLQDGLFGTGYFYGLMHQWYLENTPGTALCIYALAFLIFWAGATLLHPLISRLFTKRVTV